MFKQFFVGEFPKENESMICFYDASAISLKGTKYIIDTLVEKNKN